MSLNEGLHRFNGNQFLKLGLTGILHYFIILLADEKWRVKQIDHTLLVVLLIDIEQFANSLIAEHGL